jgi:thiol:disulfide interchange protein DsbD
MKKLIFFILATAYLFGAAPKFLMPEEAFKPSASLKENMQIEAKIELGKTIYIYDDSLKISLKDSKNISIKEVKKPKSIEHDGDKVHIDSPILLTVELAKNKDAAQTESVQLELSYQGCSEDGLCYEPETKTYTFQIETTKLAQAKEMSDAPSLPSPRSPSA